MRERLILIVDRTNAGQAPALLADLPRGAAMVQLRDKELPGRVLHELALALRDAAQAAGARFVVNDRVDVALAAGADGVHLPEAGLGIAAARALLGPRRLVGASVHSAAGARQRLEEGADYVCLAPVLETPGKGPPLGLAALAAAVGGAKGPVFALGGMASPEHAAAARRTGAHGVAVIRGAASASTILAAMRDAC